MPCVRSPQLNNHKREIIKPRACVDKKCYTTIKRETKHRNKMIEQSKLELHTAEQHSLAISTKYVHGGTYDK